MDVRLTALIFEGLWTHKIQRERNECKEREYQNR
jgi:hypothetical protein